MKPDNLQKDNYWEKFVDALSEAVLVLDLSGKILYANQASRVLLNKEITDIIGNDFSYPIELEKPSEIEILGASDKIIHAEMTIRDSVWKNNPAWIATLHNITERKEIEKKLTVLANVFTFAKEGILVTDADGKIIDVNAEFTKITQYTKEDVIGKNPNVLKSGIQDAAFYEKLWAQVNNEGYWYGELWNKKKNDDTYPQLLSISAVKNNDGDLINYVGVFYDITQQELQKKQLIRIAYYDTLTNLPNRKFLMDQLEIAMRNTQHSDRFIAIAFINLDDFKSINDLYNHKTGDNLLIKIAEIIKNSIRANDILARLGGDEFVLLMEDLAHPNDYKNVLDKIYDNLKNPLKIDEYHFSITLSAGISFYPQKMPITPGIFLSQADQAMYRSKISGKNQYSLFDLELDLEIREQENLVKEIKSAINANELKLYYQPKVNMKTRKIFGLEGLIRWQHPKKGILEPNQFLPSIKNNALIFEISDLTIKLALEQIALWKNAYPNLTISVNMNALQILEEDFFEKLKKITSAYPKNVSNRLELEILESSVISQFEKTALIMEKCKEIGIDFSLDDFGTEYSALNYLVNLPFKFMKIDAYFIKSIINKEKETKILKGILDIAKAIGIQVIAEGVETQEHMDYLTKIGCDLGQGYGISKPMPPEKFPEWYQAWNNNKKYLIEK